MVCVCVRSQEKKIFKGADNHTSERKRLVCLFNTTCLVYCHE